MKQWINWRSLTRLWLTSPWLKIHDWLMASCSPSLTPLMTRYASNFCSYFPCLSRCNIELWSASTSGNFEHPASHPINSQLLQNIMWCFRFLPRSALFQMHFFSQIPSFSHLSQVCSPISLISLSPLHVILWSFLVPSISPSPPPPLLPISLISLPPPSISSILSSIQQSAITHSNMLLPGLKLREGDKSLIYFLSSPHLTCASSWLCFMGYPFLHPQVSRIYKRSPLSLL